jgi:NitT/TauT family transport system permease protein
MGFRWIWVFQSLLLLALFAIWHILTRSEILPPFFFGEPLVVLEVIWEWFSGGRIYKHLAVTLIETILAFVIGTVAGLVVGLWLALSKTASLLLDPYIKAFNSMPRVILAPIFAVWFGLGIWSKVLLGVTLVFFIVFFSVYHGVREGAGCQCPHARCVETPAIALRLCPECHCLGIFQFARRGRHGFCRCGHW